MKKIFFYLLMSCLYIILSSCNTSDAENTFIGAIKTIENEMAIIEIEEGDILSSGNRVSVDLSVASETEFSIGDKVRVGYDGDVRETGPLGINTAFAELVE
ncbi:hypothetical protein [Oceanobacillus sp. CFH 90083]|uniref:hypothetical protein n=1 Tax=Oceanobacillus sp. CFH 90083 TaxID=2592336 RepID=UPI00128CAFC7|nr:hypothetical protein [Oceanobacillus sp. CFH 90083]